MYALNRRGPVPALIVSRGASWAITALMVILAPAVWAQTGDATLRTQLAFDVTRAIAVSFSPGLATTDGGARHLLTETGAHPNLRVEIGQLFASPRFASGTLEVGLGDPPSPRPQAFTLHLTRGAAGWALESWTTGETPMLAGTIPLTHEPTSDAAPLTMALVPYGEDAGVLRLRWGLHRWTAEIGFNDPPDGQGGNAANQAAGATGSLAFDDDTSVISRAVTLGERNESTLVASDGSRVTVLYWKNQHVEHPDFAAMEAVRNGEVVRLTEAAALRLRTEAPLRFGTVTVPTDNLAPDFPGSYGLWLTRAGSGWQLVFNNEPDAWGTQHDPDFDAVEIALTHTQNGPAERPLSLILIPTGTDQGRLAVAWGPHDWTADFVVDVDAE